MSRKFSITTTAAATGTAIGTAIITAFRAAIARRSAGIATKASPNNPRHMVCGGSQGFSCLPAWLPSPSKIASQIYEASKVLHAYETHGRVAKLGVQPTRRGIRRIVLKLNALHARGSGFGVQRFHEGHANTVAAITFGHNNLVHNSKPHWVEQAVALGVLDLHPGKINDAPVRLPNKDEGRGISDALGQMHLIGTLRRTLTDLPPVVRLMNLIDVRHQSGKGLNIRSCCSTN